MRLAELRKALGATDPAAVLVPPRILKRVIQQVNNLPTLIWKVPHTESFVVDRQSLFRHVEQDELDLEPDQRLPSTVVLISRPEGAELNEPDADALLRYWRRLFHARVHARLDERRAEKGLTLQDFRARMERIGLAEFEEIRTVLQQEHYLMPKASDADVYIEFAAVYLELKFFANNLRSVYFPGIRNCESVDRLLAEDLDYDALFTATRLPGAPEPVVQDDTSSDLSHERYWELMREADGVSRSGNEVRAALLRAGAARIAPPALADQTRDGAQAEIRRLTRRLQAALLLGEAEAAEWLNDLLAILDKAGDHESAEAGFLYDLQNVCRDHEQDIFAVDPVEWVLSGFKRPIKRPLNEQKPVRILKHLRRAASRLTLLRLSDQDRHHLTRLLHAAIASGEGRLRDHLNPVLRDAVQDVGLAPQNPPERVAFDKMIEEMLDRVVAYGYFTFSDLRDVISRNQLKLPDLEGPQQFIHGDPLLRLDRRLAILLDGVYRPSEVYMRLLERLSALCFGTTVGRKVTWYFTIPFGAAFLTVEAAELVAAKFGAPTPLPAVHYGVMAAAGFFLLALLHVTSFRRRCADVGRFIYRSAYSLVSQVVRALPLAALRRAFSSWPFQLFHYYLLKPSLACGVVWVFFPQIFDGPFEIVTVFLAVNFLLNLRPAVLLEEYVVHVLVQVYADLRAGLLPGLFRFIVRVFKHITDMMEYVLFSVDEWLRSHSGDDRLTLVTRAVLSVIWYPISYLARFYMVVLIEPGINPIKFPICSVAYKFILPFQASLTVWLAQPLVPLLGENVAYVLVFPTVWLLADAFGFLFWETKENWSLYRANRSSALKPVAIGPHGETLRGMVRPGFHSGTIPRLFARLRAAEVEACRTGNWHVARSLRAQLDELQRVVRQFVSREFVSLLLQSNFWRERRVNVGKVELSYNRVRVEIQHDHYPDRPVWIEFEERSGWFIAGIAVKGWLDALTEEQRRALTTALASLYKLAGVTLVREQVRAQLTPAVTAFDITPESLVLWLNGDGLRSLTYDLHGQGEVLRPRNPDGVRSKDRPHLRRQRLIFDETPITRQQWADSWQRDQDGHGHPQLSVEGEDLVLVEMAGREG